MSEGGLRPRLRLTTKLGSIVCGIQKREKGRFAIRVQNSFGKFGEVTLSEKNCGPLYKLGFRATSHPVLKVTNGPSSSSLCVLEGFVCYQGACWQWEDSAISSYVTLSLEPPQRARGTTIGREEAGGEEGGGDVDDAETILDSQDALEAQRLEEERSPPPAAPPARTETPAVRPAVRPAVPAAKRGRGRPRHVSAGAPPQLGAGGGGAAAKKARVQPAALPSAAPAPASAPAAPLPSPTAASAAPPLEEGGGASGSEYDTAAEIEFEEERKEVARREVGRAARHLFALARGVQ